MGKGNEKRMTDLIEQGSPEQIEGGQARAAHVTYCLMVEKRTLTTAEIMERTGLTSRQAVWSLMNNLSRGRVPVYSPTPGTWALLGVNECRGLFE